MDIQSGGGGGSSSSSSSSSSWDSSSWDSSSDEKSTHDARGFEGRSTHEHVHEQSDSNDDICSEFSSDCGGSDEYRVRFEGGCADTDYHNRQQSCSKDDPWRWWAIVFWILLGALALSFLVWLMRRT
jgi:hypothetical protein